MNLCRVVALAGLSLAVTGCMPIRQNLPLGYQGSSHGSKTQFQNPDDFKDLGPDAWKGEMEGIASWYGVDFHGHLTANGEIYNMYDMTAAHKTLPLGTVVKVTSLDTSKSVEVRINDRGPYVKGRIIDLSKSAGKAIGISSDGTTRVKLEVVRWPKDSK
jgi:rare lipoprotein A (peptidoglycan hydrolase)